jgi:Tfp pilus assembly protein PilF
VLDDPLSPQEHINLGLTYQKDGEIDHAEKEFKAAAKKLPDAYLYLGNLYFENKDMKKAEKYLRKVIAEKADLGDAYNNLAWLYFIKNENLEEAQSLAQKAIDLDPDNTTYQDTLNKIKELKAK